MGEIKTAQSNMETRCTNSMLMIESIITSPKAWVEAYGEKYTKELYWDCQEQIKEIININVINRRIRSCSR